MYNKKLIRKLIDNFYAVSVALSSDATLKEPCSDLYTNIASILYGKSYWECAEMMEDGKRNPEGKEYRRRVKECLLPIVVEQGGIFEPLTPGEFMRELEYHNNITLDQFLDLKDTWDSMKDEDKSELLKEWRNCNV